MCKFCSLMKSSHIGMCMHDHMQVFNETMLSMTRFAISILLLQLVHLIDWYENKSVSHLLILHLMFLKCGTCA